MISIIIPNYNGEKYLRGCIEALYNQTYNEINIIIIDNASTDSDYAWIHQYPHITFKRLDENYGFSKAVNEGIYLSQSEYVVLLNNDTIPISTWLSELVKTITQDKNIFSVCSKMIKYYDNTQIDDAGDEYCLLGIAVQRGKEKVIDRYTKQGEVFTSCAGASIYRKELFDKIGYFDESFFAYVEDVDIGYRSRIQGYKNVYCPDAKIYHIGSATSKNQPNGFTVKLIARNNIFMVYKNMPFLQLLFNIPFLIMGYIIKILYYTNNKELQLIYRNAVKEAINQRKNITKTKFEVKNVFNYLKIQLWLFRGTYYFIKEKIKW